MTENTTDSSAIEPTGSAPDSQEASSSESQEQQTNEDKVAYDTHRKLLGEKKRVAAENAELKARLEQYEQSKLEEQGKWQELAESATDRAKDWEGKYKSLQAQIAEERIRSQVEMKAKDLGCVDTDLLIKAMDVDSLDVVDGYKVSPQSLEAVLQKAKESKPYLFSKPAPNIQDGVPANRVESAANDLNKLSPRDKAKLILSARK